MAAGTQRCRIGPSVTNPYTRHPALTAAAIATVDELSGGRAVLALGAGGGLEQFGIDRVNPVGALREATQIIRGLTAGEKVDFAGRHFTVNGAQLGFTGGGRSRCTSPRAGRGSWSWPARWRTA